MGDSLNKFNKLYNCCGVRFKRHFTTCGTKCLRLLSPETAHKLGMCLLGQRYLDYLIYPNIPSLFKEFLPRLQTVLPGVGEIPHPIGLAAGFDKNSEVPEAFSKLGFSFLEVGTVTPRGQPGNPKPRIFRIPAERAIINRMGFNNDGAEIIFKRLSDKRTFLKGTPTAVNVGKNKDTLPERSIDDYVSVIETFKSASDFFVINISSPNTPGLRNLATSSFVNDLKKATQHIKIPIWIKFDPDMAKSKLQELIAAVMSHGFQGVVLTNTHRVEWPEAGGLSGHPLSVLSTICLEWAWEVHKGKLPIIATGGVLSGLDVLQKMMRGASAVELYTALIYQGPWVVFNILLELLAEMELRSINKISDAIGTYFK